MNIFLAIGIQLCLVFIFLFLIVFSYLNRRLDFNINPKPIETTAGFVVLVWGIISITTIGLILYQNI